jgi:predicted transcriptional regulator
MNLTIELPDEIGASLKAKAEASGVTPGEVVCQILREQENIDRAKIEWLRAAAKEGFDAADRGEGVILNGTEKLDDFMDEIYRDVSAEVASEQKRG